MVLSRKSNLRKFLNPYSMKYLRRELSFQDLGINIKLSRTLRSKGIRTPSDIQEKAIGCLLAGKNAVINSETGSGKTLAYALPMVNKVQEIKRRRLVMPRPYGLVVVPSTELQHQVSSVFGGLLGVNVCRACEDIPLRLLDTDIVVSTANFLMTYHLDVYKQVQTVVFDEADIMIAKKVGKHGYKDPLFNLIKHLLEPTNFHCLNHEGNRIYDGDNTLTDRFNITDNGDDISSHGESGMHGGKVLSNRASYVRDNCLYDNNLEAGDNRSSVFGDNRQFVFVGATMPDNEAKKSKVAMKYIRNWVPSIDLIQSENVHKVVSNVEMVYNNVLEGNKLKLLVQTLKQYSSQAEKLRVLVFVNKLENAIGLHTALTQFDYSDKFLYHPSDETNFVNNLQNFHLEWEGKIHALHKNVRVHERLEIFNRLSTSEKSLIVTTDVAARGLDFPDIDVVVQYDFATNVIDILHRAGRTGRMGKQGKVVNFITERDEALAKSVEEATGNGETLESLFSRRRGLQRKLKRAEKRSEDLVEGTNVVENRVIL